MSGGASAAAASTPVGSAGVYHEMDNRQSSEIELRADLGDPCWRDRGRVQVARAEHRQVIVDRVRIERVEDVQGDQGSCPVVPQDLAEPQVYLVEPVAVQRPRLHEVHDRHGGAAVAIVNLVKLRTLYGDRLNQVDLRFGKILRYDRTRTLIALDIFNAFNSNTIDNYLPVFGPSYLNPASITPARIAKISAQFDF